MERREDASREPNIWALCYFFSWWLKTAMVRQPKAVASQPAVVGSWTAVGFGLLLTELSGVYHDQTPGNVVASHCSVAICTSSPATGDSKRPQTMLRTGPGGQVRLRLREGTCQAPHRIELVLSRKVCLQSAKRVLQDRLQVDEALTGTAGWERVKAEGGREEEGRERTPHQQNATVDGRARPPDGARLPAL